MFENEVGGEKRWSVKEFPPCHGARPASRPAGRPGTVHSFILHSLMHSFSHSLVHPLTRLSVHSFTHSHSFHRRVPAHLGEPLPSPHPQGPAGDGDRGLNLGGPLTPALRARQSHQIQTLGPGTEQSGATLPPRSSMGGGSQVLEPPAGEATHARPRHPGSGVCPADLTFIVLASALALPGST